MAPSNIIKQSDPIMREINCPLCDHNDFVPVYTLNDRQFGLDGEFTLVRCLSCRLLYLNPQPSDEELTSYYPSEYPPYKNTISDQESYLKRVSRVHGIRKRVKAVSRYKLEGRLLEVGCGNGTFLAAMQSTRRWHVHGVDASLHSVLAAKSAHNLEVHHGKLEDASYPDNTFDVVALWDVLEHLPKPKSSLSEIRRIIAPDGLLVIRVPNFDSVVSAIFGPYWAGLDVPRHLAVYTTSSLIQMLEMSGFNVDQATHSHGTHPNIAISARFWLNEKTSGTILDWTRRIIESPITQIAITPFAKLLDWTKQGPVVTVYAIPKTCGKK